MTPPIIPALRNKYIRIFTKAHATTKDRAINPKAHGIRTGLVFSKLIREGTIRRVNDDKFYLDEAAERSSSQKRKKIAFMVVAMIVLVLAVVFGFLR